jgi:hypothetical protein
MVEVDKTAERLHVLVEIDEVPAYARSVFELEDPLAMGIPGRGVQLRVLVNRGLTPDSIRQIFSLLGQPLDLPVECIEHLTESSLLLSSLPFPSPLCPEFT